MNVFEFAMRMEVDGKQLYERLAAESGDAGLRKIFLRLAADEQKHYEVFQALNAEVQTTAMKDSTILEETKNIFQDLMGQREAILAGITVDLEGYRYAMKLEADSARLYEEAAEREKGEVKSLLLRIAAEEEKHFSVLENIYDFCNAPNQYLAWREFSNIDEFRQFGRETDL